MKTYRIIFLASCFVSLAHAAPNATPATSAQTQNINPASLKATPPESMGQIDSYKAQRAKQVDYFFTKLPQAQLPDTIITEIHRVFTPLLGILAPLSPDQTQQQRQAEVMDHIIHFYGLLYLIAEEEALEKQLSATVGQGKDTQLSTDAATMTEPKLAKPLTPAELKQSKVWQDHLKIMAASSYEEELMLLGKVHDHELAMFDYLPNFETAYYQNTFVQVRKSSELTRLYLLLVDRLRTRFLADINRTDTGDDHYWGTILNDLDKNNAALLTAKGSTKQALHKTHLQLKNQLFQDIAAFQTSPFYAVTMEFENLDWTQQHPISFTDTDGNPTTLAQVISKGYDFNEYFTIDPKTANILVNPTYGLIFEVGQDPNNSKQQALFFTALGNRLFSGNITYQKVSSKSGGTVYVGSFEKTKAPDPTKQNTQADAAQQSGAVPITFDMFFGSSQVTETVHGVQVTREADSPTLGYMELLAFTAMKLLYNDTSELFQTKNLTVTFEKLVSTDLPNFINSTPEDYLLQKEINAIQDFFANQGVTPDDGISQQGCGAVGHFFSSIGHAIAHIAETVWHGIKGAFEAAFKAIKDVGNAVWHAMKAIGDEVVSLYYASCILPMMFQGMSAKDALKHAEEYQQKANNQMDAATQDLDKAVANIATAAQDMAHAANAVAAVALTNGLSLIDPKIGNDLTGLMNSVTDGIITHMKDQADMVVEVGSSLVKLSAEAVQLCTAVVGGLASGGAFTGAGISALGDEFKDLAENTASAVLGFVTLYVKQFTDAMKSAMQSCAYFIQTLTDAVIDTCAAVATLFYYGWADGWSGGFNKIEGKLNQHRRLISSIVTTAVLIGVTVATGGAATPFAAGMLAVNIGMMTMNIIGSAQSDQAAIDKQKKQEHFVAAYKQYVIENAAVIEGFNTSKAIEELVQLQTETMNQERALLYYQNYLNAIFNGSLSSQAYGTFAYMHNQLESRTTTTSGGADVTGVMQADLGSLYGIQTGRMCLTPSGGFAVYNSGRGTYSQEAAMEPMLVPGQINGNPLSEIQRIKTFWFHQKDLANIPAGQPLKADVLWRSLYEYDGEFYIGVYLTERFIDTQAMNKLFSELSNVVKPTSGTTTTIDFDSTWESVDSLSRYLYDYDHLAKMFVCYRTGAAVQDGTQTTDSTPRLGVYVHEAPTDSPTKNTDGWINPTTPFAAINFKSGTWYRMQTELNGQTLKVTFWEVGNDTQAEEAKTSDTPPANALSQTITVNQATIPQDAQALMVKDKFAGSMGVITSGASVEYVVLEPTKVAVVQSDNGTTTLTSITTPQKSANRTQADHTLSTVTGMNVTETERERNWHQQLPKQMNPTFGKFNLTGLSESAIMSSQYIYTAKGTISPTVDDYLVFVASVTNPTALEVGVNPAGATQPVGLMSLVSGELYNEAGDVVGRVDHPIDLYQGRHPALSADVTKQMQTSQTALWNAMKGPFNFSNIALNGIVDAMTQGAFVYSGPALESVIQGRTDYFVMASTNAVGINQTGQPLILGNNNNITALVSLATGKVYNLQVNDTTPTVINSSNIAQIKAIATDNTHDVFDTYKAKLSSTIQQAITTLQTTYKTAAQVNTADQKLLADGQTAQNTLNTTASTIDAKAALATGNVVTQLTNAKTGITTALSSLQAALTKFQAAQKNGPVATSATEYSTLQSAITTANNANTTAQTAITAADTALKQAAQTTPDSYGGYGDSYGGSYGSSSSYQNYNTTYGSIGYGDDSYGGYGDNSGY